MATEDELNNDNDETLIVADDPHTPSTPEDRGDVVTPVANEGSEHEAGSPQPADRMIPLSRFNAVNDRAKALQEQNQQLIDALTRAAPPAAPEPAPMAVPDSAELLKSKRTEYHKALMDGEEGTALSLQAEIDELVEQRATTRALNSLMAQQQTQQREHDLRSFEATVSDIQNTFPQLDASHPQADSEAILFVVAKRDALIASGLGLAESLRQASESVAKLFGFDAQTPHTSGANSDNRTMRNNLRNAQAANAQPAPLSGVGNRASAPQRQDVAKMTDEEFDALPASEKKRLRGD